MSDDRRIQCPGCGYDLQGRAIDSEFCPECGAYLTTSRSDETTTNIDPHLGTPLVLRRTHQTDAKCILVRNANLPPALVKKHLTAAANAAEGWLVGGIVLIIFSLALILILGVSMMNLLPRLIQNHPVVTYALLLAMHLVAYRFVFKSLVIDRLIRRRVRRSLREKGIEVCLRCGWHFGEVADDVDICPYCHAKRTPLLNRETSS